MYFIEEKKIKISDLQLESIFCGAEETQREKIKIIIFVPGGTGFELYKKHNLVMRIINNISKQGYLAIAYNGRGQGKSEGFRNSQLETHEDLIQTIKYIKELYSEYKEVSIGLVGISVGGYGAIKFAIGEKIIRSIITWGTLPSYKLAKNDGRTHEIIKKYWLSNPKRIQFEEYFEQYKCDDPIDYIKELTQPILFLGGGADDKFFRNDEQKAFIKAAENSRLKLLVELPGISHQPTMNDEQFHLLTNLIVFWFNMTMI